MYCAQYMFSCSVMSDFAPPCTPGSSVHGILQARMLEWQECLQARMPFPPLGDLLDSGVASAAPALAGGFFITEPPGNPPANAG